MIASWKKFWFEADGRVQFRAFRAIFGSILFFAYLARFNGSDYLFGEDGLIGGPAVADLMSQRPNFYLRALFASPLTTQLAQIGFLVALLGLAFGRHARLPAIIAYVLHLSFFHRNPFITYGVDFVASFYLFFLCLADDRHPSKIDRGDLRAQLGSVAFRLSQIQLCIIYGYAGIKKLQGAHWWSGEALWDALNNPLLARWNFEWLGSYPWAVVGATYLVLAWEIYFPAMVWNKRLRPPLLGLGVVFHLIIAITLNIPYFSAAMVSTYLFFVDPRNLGLSVSEWDGSSHDTP